MASLNYRRYRYFSIYRKNVRYIEHFDNIENIVPTLKPIYVKGVGPLFQEKSDFALIYSKLGLVRYFRYYRNFRYIEHFFDISKSIGIVDIDPLIFDRYSVYQEKSPDQEMKT